MDVLLVMVHVWDDDPDVPEVKWQEFGKKCALHANLLSWPKIWQFDFINKDFYYQIQAKKSSSSQNLQLKEDGKVPHRVVLFKENDWVSTSDQDTKQIIEKLNPKIVLFGGLHKDLCVRGTLLNIRDHTREYLESDLLSYTWRETLKKAKDYDPTSPR